MSRLLALFLALVSLPAVVPRAVAGPAAGPRLQSQTQAPAATSSAKIWIGRNDEFEKYIRTAEVDRIVEVPIGVTKPKRAYFKVGGLAASVAWKVLPPGRPSGFWESYKSEIAAYELDKLLGMNMVPVAVERTVKGDVGAAILWVEPVNAWKTVEKAPKPPSWNRQAIMMKMFDNLIGNKDRNMGNLLVDDEWNLFLIDHSRAFIDIKELAVPVVATTRIDRELWTKMLALDEPTLVAAIGKWADMRSIRAMLVRRDRMKIAIDKLVKDTSDAAVFSQ